MNKKLGVGVSTVIAIITVVGVGTYNFDFSDNSTNINDSSTTIGDSITTNINDFREGMILDTVCLADPIPDEYVKPCAER